MEVVHRRTEEDVMVVVEEQLRTRWRQPDFAGHSGDDVTSAGEMNDEFEVHKNGISPKSVVYFEKNEGMWKCHHCIWTHKIGHHWIHLLHEKSFNQGSTRGNILKAGNESEISKHVNDIINHQNDIVGDMKDGTLSISSVIVGEENVRVEIVEGSDEEEEVIELEFEKAVDKLHTHTPHCPNCSNQITKVILRRKKRRQPSNLLGCFNCFTVFIPSGGHLNPFGFLKSKPKLESAKVEEVQPSIYGGGTTTNAAESSKVEDEHPSTEVVESTTSNAAVSSGVYNLFSINGKREKNIDQNEEILEREDQEGEAKPEINLTHVTIDIEARTGGRIETNIHERGEIDEQPLISGNIQRSTSFEILKCIVYGGLIESITSLSVVSSAVASDVPTLNVVTIGLASVFSGLIIFGCNLLELRNEATPNDKYQELLGRRGHFLLHSTFAIFSYLVYGLIAPTTYGFAFRESDNKDYKLIAVAVASITCIFILSIAKAYVTETEKFVGYVKTISYYVTVAVGASGLAYAAGDLFGMLLHDFGWFQSAQDVTPPAWVSY